MTKRYPGVFRVRFKNRQGENQWSRTYFIAYTHRGKRIREKTGTTSEEIAWNLRVQRLHEINQGRFVGPHAGKITAEHLEQIVQDDLMARRKKTVVARWFSPVRGYFGPATMRDLTPADLNAYVRKREKDGTAPGTVVVELAWLRRGFRLAVQSRLLPDVPTFPKIQVDNARMVFADWPVVEQLLPHLPAHLRPVILTAHFSGWRKEAILCRERALHLDLDGRWLYLERTASKGKMPVRIWLNDTLLEVLRAQDALAREIERRTGRMVPWVYFYPEDGHNERAGGRIVNFDNRWRLAREASGLKIRFHDLRRGAIRELRRAGFSEHEIMQWVGLKTRAVFDRYDIIDEKRLQEMGERQQRHHERTEMESRAKMARFPVADQ